MKKVVLVLVVLSIAFNCLADKNIYENVKVTQIKSGISFELENGDRVALLGCKQLINHDTEAEDFVFEKIHNKNINLSNILGLELTLDLERKYLMAYIQTEDGEDLGLELIANGLASVDTSVVHPNAEKYKTLSDWACDNKIGYWALPEDKRLPFDSEMTEDSLKVKKATSRTRESLLEFFESQRENLQRCFRITRRENPALHGKMYVILKIMADGSVSEIKVKSSTWSEQSSGKNVERCVVNKVRRWKYEPIEKGETWTEFTLLFN